MDANPLAHSLLLQCLKRLNKTSALVCEGKINITPRSHNDYLTASTPDRLAAHDYLNALARQVPQFQICYHAEGFDEIPILKSIVIGNTRAVLKALNIDVLAEVIEADIQLLQTQLQTAPSWLQDAFRELADTWRNSKSIHRFSNNRKDALLLGIRFASWLAAQDNLNIDFRTASVKAFGDSKTLENNLPAITDVLILSGRHDLSIAYSHAEILAEWGVSKFSPLLRIRGKCRLELRNSAISTLGATPYIAMPLEQLAAISLVGHSPYILLIENLSSFERYCREIDDDGVIIYTSGFPPRQWITPVQRLIAAVQCPVYHWGDIDLGGYQILAYLDRQLDGKVIPYRMFNEPASNENRIDLKALTDTIAAASNPHISHLHKLISEALKQNKVVCGVEQESLDPVSPLHFA